jgi:ATP-dependent DNA helicase RecG
LLGTRQTGDISFRVADLRAHEDLLDEAHAVASKLSKETASALIRRWTGDRARFARV